MIAGKEKRDTPEGKESHQKSHYAEYSRLSASPPLREALVNQCGIE